LLEAIFLLLRAYDKPLATRVFVMPKMLQPPLKIHDYVVEFFDFADLDGIKRFYLLFAPQGYTINPTKLEPVGKLMLVASKHTANK